MALPLRPPPIPPTSAPTPMPGGAERGSRPRSKRRTAACPSSVGRGGASCSRSPAPATSSRSATWTPATGPPTSPAARASATRCSSVILLSNLMAVLLQGLASKLGIVTGRDLAQACRDHYSKPVAFVLWVLCEIAIAACDLAEVIGTAIALNLLFGIPLPLRRRHHGARRAARALPAEQAASGCSRRWSSRSSRRSGSASCSS